jgi:hypothetical protein
LDLVDVEGADSGEWDRIGRELKKIDPQRYAHLRSIAERIVLTYTQPDHPVLQTPAHPVICSQRPKGSA